jgi:hypothetical protein
MAAVCRSVCAVIFFVLMAGQHAAAVAVCLASRRSMASRLMGRLEFSGQPLVSLRATPYRRENGWWYCL